MSAETIPQQYPEILQIDTADIELRLASKADAPEMYGLLLRNREHLEQFQHLLVAGLTPEKLQESINTNVDYMTSGEWLQYRIIHENKILGNVTMYEKDDTTKTAKLGYWIDQDYQGRGYAYAASKRLIEYGFSNWGLEKVLLTIDPENVRSERLAERLGARLIAGEGTENSGDGKRVWEIQSSNG